MPRLIKRLLILILAAAVILPVIPVSASAEDGLELAYFDLPVTINTITVGLRSGSTALYEARLQNRVGSGFSFGHYDITRSFVSIGSTDKTDISLRGDTGFYLDEETYIGSWHVLLNDCYPSFDDANAAATSNNGFPAFINGQYRVLIGAFEDAAAVLTDVSIGAFVSACAAVICADENVCFAAIGEVIVSVAPAFFA